MQNFIPENITVFLEKNGYKKYSFMVNSESHLVYQKISNIHKNVLFTIEVAFDNINLLVKTGDFKISAEKFATTIYSIDLESIPQKLSLYEDATKLISYSAEFDSHA